MATTGKLFSSFLCSLKPQLKLPEQVFFINPYKDKVVRKLVREFAGKYYKSNRQRILILGINSGRFGAGITGIPFTDPLSLVNDCGIENDFDKRQELSSKFIYEMINAFGGTTPFYNHFLLSAVCPLGFVKGNINYNYYDSRELLESVTPLILDSLLHHSKMNINCDVVVALGKKNGEYLKKVNNQLGIFKEVISLDHPRYIMQYKLSQKRLFIDDYLNTLHKLLK